MNANPACAYFSELTGDVRRFNNMLGVVYTDRKGDARNYVFALYQALRKRDLAAAQRIWNAKFEKAVERYLSLIRNQTSHGAERKPSTRLRGNRSASGALQKKHN